MQFHSALFSRLIVDPRLADRAGDLIGPNVQLRHTKRFIKPPERAVPDASGLSVCSHEKDTMIASIPFRPLRREQGVCGWCPAATNEALWSTGWWPPPAGRAVSGVRRDAMSGSRGCGAVLQLYDHPHGSGVNTSDEPRTTLWGRLRDPTDHPLGLHHLARTGDAAAWHQSGSKCGVWRPVRVAVRAPHGGADSRGTETQPWSAG